MQRRDFLKLGSAATLGLASHGQAAGPRRRHILSGVQIAPVSLFDEGIESCLDRLQETAAINALFIYSHTYHMGMKPPNVLADDHGVPVRDPRTRNLPRRWVRHQSQAFADQIVQHQDVTASHEYADRDLFEEIQRPARERGMKIYARLLEAGARRKAHIPGYERVLTIDHEGRPGNGPCWNNPHYRDWVFTTVRELVERYSLDGLQYGAERTGPLSDVLFHGRPPACFCRHCVRRNEDQGIDVQAARRGFQALHILIRQVESGRPLPPDGLFTQILRILHRHPAVLSWDYQWFQADEEICTQVHRIAKAAAPAIDSGRHVDHQRSSLDLFYRSAVSYEQIAANADFIKPILYHEAMGPRLRWWVLERMQQRVLNDLTLEQSLELFYAVFGHDRTAQPQLDELDARGLGPEYVEREVRRCRDGAGNAARIYAGIGIDVPWYVEDGMEPRPSDPALLEEVVRRAIDAGADGVLASREYDEMRLSSLKAFGRGVRT